MIEKIEWGGKTLAIVLRAAYSHEGVNFITPESSPLQLGVLQHPQGTRIRPHIHKSRPRSVNELYEVLHIDRGRVEAEFYEGNKPIAKVDLYKGDTILLMSGGHGFNIMEDSRIIEVKQGPYTGIGDDKQALEVDG